MKEKTRTNSKSNMLKKQKGITLIALVVTIIILLILAGVTLNVALSDNGLFKKSQEATNKNKVETYKEALEMIKAETYIDVANDNSKFLEKFKENFETEIEKSNTSLKGATIEYLDASKTVLVVTTEDKQRYVIQENGIEHKGNDESDLIKRAGNITIKPKDDYGKVVTGFNSKTEGLTWRLWYVDNVDPSDPSKDTIYLISDFITTVQAPTKTINETTYTVIGGNNEYCSYFGTNDTTGIMPAYTHNETTNNIGSTNKWIWDNNQEISSKWLSQWYAYGTHKTEGDNLNMRAVAYMTDSSIWTEKFGDTSNKEKYVIGGPTLEMFCASYKDSHSSEYLECYVEDDIGYKVKWYGKNDTSEGVFTSQNGVDSTSNNRIYSLGNENNPTGMWLASPNGHATNRLMAEWNSSGIGWGNVRNNVTAGFIPITCLKSGVQIERSGDGFRLK